MSNIGAYPLETGTPVTTFRVLAGDANASPTDIPGEGQFELWSDAEIEVYLDLSPDNIYRAIAAAYTAIAGQAAVQAKTIKDYDLQVSMEKRSDKLLSVAAEFNRKADLEDLTGDNAPEFFDIIGGRSVTDGPDLHGEASPWRMDNLC